MDNLFDAERQFLSITIFHKGIGIDIDESEEDINLVIRIRHYYWNSLQHTDNDHKSNQKVLIFHKLEYPSISSRAVDLMSIYQS